MAELLTDRELISLGRVVARCYEKVASMERWTGSDAEPEIAPWAEGEFDTRYGEKFGVRVYRKA